MMREEMNRLAAQYLQVLKTKPSNVISSAEALIDVTPIDWDSDVMEGKRTVTVAPDPEHRLVMEDGIAWIAE